MLGFCLKCDSPRHFWESLHPSKGGNPCLRTVAKIHGRLRGLPLGQNGSPLPLSPIRSRSVRLSSSTIIKHSKPRSTD
jgi:hypothetical protein